MSAFCNNCGAAAGGASFCPNCGSSIGMASSNFQAPNNSYQGGNPSTSTAMWAHLGNLFAFVFSAMMLGWIPSLIIRGSATAQRDRYVFEQATEALNFQLQWLLVNVGLIVVTVITCGIGGILYFATWLLVVIFGIMASAATSRGENFRYPMMFFRLIK